MIKKLLLAALLAASISLGGSNQVNAQWVILGVNFDGYAGTVPTMPSGIFISWNTASSFYTSAGNYGVSAPSYKFGNDSNYIVTGYMTDIDSITFWMKGNGTPLSPLNELRFYHSPDSINYTLFATIDSLPTTGTNYKIAGNLVNGNIKIEYSKALAGGNLAFDDLKIYSGIAIGLNEPVSNEEITVYPTPTSGNINIKSALGGQPPYVEVFDMIGNMVFSGKAERKSSGVYAIDLSNKNKGFYFLKIRTANEVATKRITLID